MAVPKKALANPVHDAARQAFAESVEEWQTQLGLGDWRMHVSDQPAKRCAADVSLDLEARLATIRIGESTGTAAVTPDNIEGLACHEVLHVFLCELIGLCRSPGVSESTINSAEHRVVNTLQRLLTIGKP